MWHLWVVYETMAGSYSKVTELEEFRQLRPAISGVNHATAVPWCTVFPPVI